MRGWNTAWFAVPPKPVNYALTLKMWWTTTWFTVLPKLRESGKLIQIRWTIAWITVPPKPLFELRATFLGELLPGLPYLRNTTVYVFCATFGELLPGLRYIRNLTAFADWLTNGELLLGLPYLRNDMKKVPTPASVNYYLDYRTSETEQ